MTDFTGKYTERVWSCGDVCDVSREGGTCVGRSSENEVLKPGDRVIWWKRIPGGDYVYPVQATVLALTEKRVKIEADDDGEIVIRYVPRESVQRQG